MFIFEVRYFSWQNRGRLWKMRFSPRIKAFSLLPFQKNGGAAAAPQPLTASFLYSTSFYLWFRMSSICLQVQYYFSATATFLVLVSPPTFLLHWIFSLLGTIFSLIQNSIRILKLAVVVLVVFYLDVGK